MASGVGHLTKYGMPNLSWKGFATRLLCNGDGVVVERRGGVWWLLAPGICEPGVKKRGTPGDAPRFPNT